MPIPRASWSPFLPSLLALLCGACGGPPSERAAPAAGTDRPAATPVAAGGASAATAIPVAFDPRTWRPPAESEIPADSMGASIRRGLALLRDTPDSLPRYAPGRIGCTNCHLDAGRDTNSAALTGAFARYPRYLSRSGAVVAIADRVNYCFTRSLAGRRLPDDSREMHDLVAYLAFLSRGVPIGAGDQLPGTTGQPRIPGDHPADVPPAGDTASGATLYAARCVSCHGADGAGRVAGGTRIPALWGPRSYAVGASMARQERAAAFIWHNMPLGQGRSLTPAQAYDLSAYVNAHARPDSPGKAGDWPGGKAPVDVPYALGSGHLAFHAPPVLPRAGGAATLVPAPAPAPR